MKALGLIPKRYRRTAEFECEEQLQKWDDFMKEHHLTLTKLCNGLIDGTVDILFRDDY